MFNEKKLTLDVHYEAYQAIELAQAIKRFEGKNFSVLNNTMDFSNKFALTICRIEKENNIPFDLILVFSFKSKLIRMK